MSMLAGSNEANEGFFRPIEVITKKGTSLIKVPTITWSFL